MKTELKIAALAALAATSLSAAAKLSEGKAYGDWKGTCQGNECGAIQIVNNEKGEPVGRILLRRIPEANNSAIAFITVPLGVNLRAGMALAADGKELVVAPFDFCDQGGCNAAIPVEGDIEASLKKGKVLQVAAFVGDKQQTMGFSLKGVSEVLKNL